MPFEEDTLHEITAGGAGLGGDVADALGVGQFAEEFSYQGGTLPRMSIVSSAR